MSLRDLDISAIVELMNKPLATLSKNIEYPMFNKETSAAFHNENGTDTPNREITITINPCLPLMNNGKKAIGWHKHLFQNNSNLAHYFENGISRCGIHLSNIMTPVISNIHHCPQCLKLLEAEDTEVII